MRDTSAEPLFRPLRIKNLTLPNRVVMAPMTRWRSPQGVPDAEVAAYYRRRAENDCGLITTEGTTIDHPVAAYSRHTPRFFGTRALAGWQRVVDEVHTVGGRIVPQLWHVGAMRPPSQVYPNRHRPSASPSGLYAPGKAPNSAPMSKAAIRAVVDAFAQGARDACALGFDGIEIHGAHGYLIDQFFWPALNRRDDEYGGDLEGRTRFAVEIIRAIRREVGADFPLIFRFSQWKQQDYAAKLADTPQALGDLLNILVEAGVDVFHCSQRRFWEPEFSDSSLNLAGWAKRLTGKPTITVGSVGLTKAMEGGSKENLASGAAVAKLDGLFERLARDEFDLVAVGRGILADPAWARKVREGRSDEIEPFRAQALEVLT